MVELEEAQRGHSADGEETLTARSSEFEALRRGGGWRCLPCRSGASPAKWGSARPRPAGGRSTASRSSGRPRAPAGSLPGSGERPSLACTGTNGVNNAGTGEARRAGARRGEAASGTGKSQEDLPGDEGL